MKRQQIRLVSQHVKAKPIAVNILDKWTPLKSPPSLFSRSGLDYRFEVFKHFILSSYGVYLIKKHLKTWKPVPFARESLEKYIEMNKACLLKDKVKLSNLVTTGMFQEFKDFISKNDGMRYDYKFKESSRPKVVAVRVAKIQTEYKGPEHRLVQVTVSVEGEQSVQVFRKNQLVADGKPENVNDHIVLENIITNPENSDWKIAGKI